MTLSTPTWHITQLQRHLADGCVFQVEYSVTASQDGFTSQWTGCLDLPRPEGSMIPFSALTEELVISWVQEALGSEKLEQLVGTLQDGIESQRHVTTGTGLPWLMEHPDETVLVRARNELGQYVGDDPETPTANEAWTEVPLQDA